MKCQCKLILGIDPVFVHLFGCPETNEYKEYHALPWYKKLFKQDPHDLDLEHLKS